MSIYNHIHSFLQTIENPIVFELGVHWAEDTPRIINWCKTKPEYHGFEPDSRNIAIATESIQKNELTIKLNHGAISDKVGTTKLYLSDGIHAPSGNQMTGANSIRKPKIVVSKHRWIDFTKEEQNIKTFTIDQYCEDNDIKKIDFIWADIQGCEYDMIVGAKQMLPNIKMMLLEYSNEELYEGQKNLDAILNLLGSDWQLIEKTPADVLVKNKKHN